MGLEDLILPLSALQLGITLVISGALVLISVLGAASLALHLSISAKREAAVARYASLQGELLRLTDALRHLESDLTRRNPDLDLQPLVPRHQLAATSSFWEDKERRPDAVWFCRCLRDASSTSNDIAGDFETSGQLITPDRLDAADESLTQLSGMLWRRKRYKWVLYELGFCDQPENCPSDFDAVEFTTSPIAQHMGDTAMPDSSLPSSSLAFWEDLINRALDRTTRMTPLVSLIFEYQGEELRPLTGLMIAFSVFCVALPLVPMFFNVAASAARASFAIAGIAFVLLLATTIVYFCRTMLSGLLRRPVSNT